MVVNPNNYNVFAFRPCNVFRAKQFSSAVYLHAILIKKYLELGVYIGYTLCQEYVLACL